MGKQGCRGRQFPGQDCHQADCLLEVSVDNCWTWSAKGLLQVFLGLVRGLGHLVIEVVKHGGGNNFMVWGCMGWNGVEKLIEVEGCKAVL
jgi:hypothetical protein